jgi:hypothetical protein
MGKTDGGHRDARSDAPRGQDAKHDGARRDGLSRVNGYVLDAGFDAAWLDAGEPYEPDAGADPCDGVSLSSLAITPLTLTPAFSPDVHDYYVQCAAGENALSVTVAGADGATTSLTAPITRGPAAEQTVMLSMAPDEAVVAVASAGGASCEYWVRCLPPDFPKLQLTAHPEAGAPPPGYYLLGDTYVAMGERGYAIVMDLHGVPVWYGRSRNGQGTKTIQLLDSNTIAYVPIAGYTFTDYEGAWEIHTLNPVGVKYLATVGMPVDTHELRRLPNGNFLLFGDPVVGHVDLSDVAMGKYGSDANILDCAIQELTPSGQLVWQWLAYQDGHIDPDKESTFDITEPANGVSPLNPDGGTVDVVDVFHCNSIDWDSEGNLLVSARDMDSVFLIANPGGSGPNAGKVLWKLGPPGANGRPYSEDGARYIALTSDPAPVAGFYRQHHVRYIADNAFTVFDDRTLAPSSNTPDRGLIVSFDLDAGTAAVDWQYVGTGTTPGMGSMTVLKDGSHVIGWGYVTAPGAVSFTETDPDGNDLVDFVFAETPTADSSYRATKVAAADVDLEAMRRSIGPWSSGTGVRDAGRDH